MMDFTSFDRLQDVEHPGDGFVEVSSILSRQDDVFVEMVTIDMVQWTAFLPSQM